MLHTNLHRKLYTTLFVIIIKGLHHKQAEGHCLPGCPGWQYFKVGSWLAVVEGTVCRGGLVALVFEKAPHVQWTVTGAGSGTPPL